MRRRALPRLIAVTTVTVAALAGLGPVPFATAAPTAPGTVAGQSSGEVAAARNTVWLCRPGLRPNPCEGSLTTTRQAPNGRQKVMRTKRATSRPVDCFYLYPTVSTQPGAVADLTIDPEQRSMASYQAARFSQVCKVYAPMYRQITLAGLGSATPADREIAYRSALSGWRSYLRNDNNGRGVILIGHSQGASLLRRIMAETIDDRPALRKRVVTSILAGTSVAVRKGTLDGGDFRHIPGCRSDRDLNCVMSFATFGQTPPDDSYFGVLRDRPSGKPWGPRYEALCTDPGALAGRRGALVNLYPSKPLYGVFGVVQAMHFEGDVPTAATPWVYPAQRYRAACETSNGAHVLMVKPIGSAPALAPAPTPQWGLHLLDLNLPLGDLIQVTRTQIRHYERTQQVPVRPGRG